MSCSTCSLYTMWKVNSTYTGLSLQTMPQGRGFIKSWSSLSIYFWWPLLWCFDYRVLLDLLGYTSESLKRYTLRGVRLCAEGEKGLWSKWITWQRCLSCEIEISRKLCLVPCHSCHIYETRMNNKVEGTF